MEDAQPNEVRLARKGSTSIPRVRITRQAYSPYRRPPSYPRPPHSAGPSRWHPPARPLAPQSSTRNNRAEENGLVVVEAHLPPECHRGMPRSRATREAWIQGQKRHLETTRRLSVVLFNYSDDYRRVLFTCRARQDIQSTAHHAEGSLQRQVSLPPAKSLHPSTHIPAGLHPVDVHSGTDCIRITRQGAITPKARDTHSNLAQVIHTTGSSKTWLNSPQSDVPGPSCISLGPSFPVQSENTSPLPAHQVPARAATRANNAAELVSHISVEEEHSTRWTTFRSGHMDIDLPSLSSGSRVLSSETETGRQYIDQLPSQDSVQPEEMPVERCSDSNLYHALPNIRSSDSVPRMAKDHQKSELFTDHILDMVRGHSALPEALDSPLRSPTPACDIVTLSLGPFDKPRRLLNNDGFTYIVTAHGVIDQLSANSMLNWDRSILSPASPLEEFVDDACILSHQGEPIIILGHAREQDQISLLNSGRGQVSRPITLSRDQNTSKRFGVSAVTSLMSPLKFASGGYDRRVHIWDIAQDLSGASAVELAIKHSSVIHSLLPILDSSHKLVSAGADRSVSIYDMSAERVVQTIRLSCFPSHVHKIDSEFCTLLEISHLETQFEIRDYRTPLQVVSGFGFVMEERRGRYDKADTWSYFVACGDRNGAVRFWDLRNVSKEVAIRQRFNDPVTQVVHIGSRWLACSKRSGLACIDFQGE